MQQALTKIIKVTIGEKPRTQETRSNEHSEGAKTVQHKETGHNVVLVTLLILPGVYQGESLALLKIVEQISNKDLISEIEKQIKATYEYFVTVVSVYGRGI